MGQVTVRPQGNPERTLFELKCGHTLNAARGEEGMYTIERVGSTPVRAVCPHGCYASNLQQIQRAIERWKDGDEYLLVEGGKRVG